MYPANITREEAQVRSQLLATSAYRVSLDLTGRMPDGNDLPLPEATFVSHAAITFTSGAGGHSHVNILAEAVLEASLDGNPFDVSHFDGERVEFDVTPGEHRLAIAAVCRYSNTGEGLHRFVDPADDRVYLYTQLEVADARRVYPCFEQPDLKARFQFTVTAPEGWSVISNSAEVQPTSLGDGFGRWEFAPTPPISTYITALIAGEYHTVHDSYPGRHREIPLSLSCRQSVIPQLDAERIFAVTKHGFAIFEEHFGEPYPFDDYAQVFVPEFNAGAMENAGCVTIRDEYLFRSRVTAASYEGRDNTILHELAHMWFGDLVTMTWWDDLWLNESFAEWASHWAQSEIRSKTGTGDDPWTTFCNQRKTWAYRQDQLPSTHPIAADMVDLEAVEQNFDGITYAKGASALRQLVAFVGLEDFLAGLRIYFARHAFGNSTLPDLLKALEESSGRDLSRFTGEWLQTAGVNTLRAELDSHEGRFTRFAVRQSATEQWPTLRQHRMAIGCYELVEGRLIRVSRFETDIDQGLTEIPELIGQPVPALVLLNDDDLTYAKIRIDHGLETVIDGIQNIESSLTRALCWSACWDMCRDAEMRASDYADMVLRGVALESDLTAVGTILAQVRMAIDYYTPKHDVERVNDVFTRGLAHLLKTAAPGSDHQLAFARALATSVRTEPGIEVLRAWLAGDEVPTGLSIDADLRWRLITELARLGAVGEADIAAELAHDQTAQGRERAAGARAAQPTAAAKAEAWRLATSDSSVPNETHTQICAQFWQHGQEEVLRPYLDSYIDVVQAISDQADGWGGRSFAIRSNVLSLLFPRPLGTRQMAAGLTLWRDVTPLSDSVTRVLNERLDDVERALRCQEAAA
ncbi:MAG: aminopeptidase N [Micropruina sp.]